MHANPNMQKLSLNGPTNNAKWQEKEKTMKRNLKWKET